MSINVALWFGGFIRVFRRAGAVFCSLFKPANWRMAWQYTGAYLENVNDADPYGGSTITCGARLRDIAGKPSFLLYSHELSRTGAPQALLHMAQSLKKLYGTNPVVLSPKPGPLAEEFERCGFTVVVDAAHGTGRRSGFLADYAGGFDLVVANSICSAPFIVRYAECCRKMAVWLHDSGTALAGLSGVFFGRDLSRLRNAPASLWLVGGQCVPIADAFRKKYEYLCYGLPEATLPAAAKDKTVTTFLLAGELCRRKGQMLFLDAVQALPRAVRERARFIVVGGDQFDPGYAWRVRRKAASMAEVRVEPSMPFAELLERYARSDCLVCPSESDPMPIVVSHAFMFGMPVIVSDGVGQAFTANGVPGVTTVPVGDTKALVDALSGFVELHQSGKAPYTTTRALFDAHFSVEMFERTLKRLVDERLQDRP